MLRRAVPRTSLLRNAVRGAVRPLCDKPLPSGVIVDNNDMSTGMEKKEIMNTPDIFWSREPIMGCARAQRMLRALRHGARAAIRCSRTLLFFFPRPFSVRS